MRRSSEIYTETDSQTRFSVRHMPDGRHELELFIVTVGDKDTDRDFHSFTALSRAEAIALRDALTTVLEA